MGDEKNGKKLMEDHLQDYDYQHKILRLDAWDDEGEKE